MSTIFNRLRQAFRDKAYRQVYADGFSDSKIATQIKVLREQRGWTQQQLADAAGMKQSRIATLEDVNYSSWSIRTLRRLAETFDLWFDVEFKEFGTVWPQLQNFTRESLTRRSFADDPAFKEGEAERTPTIQDKGITSAFLSSSPQERASENTAVSALTAGLGHEFTHQGSYARSTYRLPSGTFGINFGIALGQTALHSSESDEAQSPHRRSGALAAIV